MVMLLNILVCASVAAVSNCLFTCVCREAVIAVGAVPHLWQHHKLGSITGSFLQQQGSQCIASLV
jgi:hypothetical protein